MYIYSNRGAIEFFGPSPGRRLPSPATASQVTASKMHPLPAYFAGHLYAFQTTTTIQVEWLVFQWNINRSITKYRLNTFRIHEEKTELMGDFSRRNEL